MSSDDNMLDTDALETLKNRFLIKFPDFRHVGEFEAIHGGYWELERSYKQAMLEEASLVNLKDPRAPRDLLRLLFGSNFLDWREAERVRQFVEEHSGLMDEAILYLVRCRDGDEALAVGRFVERIWPTYEKGHEANRPFNDLRIVPSALLALVKPSRAIAIRYQPFNIAGTMLLGRPVFRNMPLSVEQYRDILEMSGAITRALRSWGWRPRDLWDVQGFIWSTCRQDWNEEGKPAPKARDALPPPPPPAPSPSATVPSPDPSPAPPPPSPPRPPSSPPPPTPIEEANTEFVPDDAETERDELGRGVLAIALGRRLHRIWCRNNDVAAPDQSIAGAAAAVDEGGDRRGSFVLHLDAPWGGGKTTFANLLAGVLNPFRRSARAPAFLRERYGERADLGTVFLGDPGAPAMADWPKDARRPWIVIPFNAWQVENCAPPWWIFFESIRKGCFSAIRREGNGARDPRKTVQPGRPLSPWPVRWGNWLLLWGRELLWRCGNPKLKVALATLALCLLFFGILGWAGLITRTSDGSLTLTANGGLGLLLVAVSGIGFLWSAASLISNTVFFRADVGSETSHLGGGDPLERFRRHFARTMRAVRRPILIVIDDLDRCRPDFVVDLVRGIQTLLRSPRVVFVILGDREWIEHAFEAHHQAMNKVNVGPEQSFGARFVEKAIQISFILPAIPEDRQRAYVRRVLLGGAIVERAPLDSKLAGDIRRLVRENAEGDAPLDVAVVEQALGDRLKRHGDPEAVREQVEKLVNEERAIHAAVDLDVEREIRHRLEQLAPYFPANPRQIKRIINSITIYYAVALQQKGMETSDPLCFELAIWIVIMTEWPQSWRAIARQPALIEEALLKAPDAAAALEARFPELGPPARAALAEELGRIRSDPTLLALLLGPEDKAWRLQGDSVRAFADLAPLYARRWDGSAPT